MKKTIKTKGGFRGYYINDQSFGLHVCKIKNKKYTVEYKDDIIFLTGNQYTMCL